LKRGEEKEKDQGSNNSRGGEEKKTGVVVG
jgi:hypothetical protein